MAGSVTSSSVLVCRVRRGLPGQTSAFPVDPVGRFFHRRVPVGRASDAGHLTWPARGCRGPATPSCRYVGKAPVAVRGRGNSRTIEVYRSLLRRHIVPGLGDVMVNGLTAERVRAWRHRLLRAGASATTTAKADRLLRAVMATAMDDELVRRNPCRIKGASVEPTPERPVATMEGVWRLVDRMPDQFRALVLLATFASLRWGEVTALRRRHLDLGRRVVRVVALPPKIIPELARHVAAYAEPGADGLVFVTEKGRPLRRSNFDKSVPWHKVVADVGLPGLRFHDLRHTGNTLAAPYASTRELMARMGHSSTRAALIYQHATADRDRAIADALDALLPEGSAVDLADPPDRR
jgi:integrase